MGNVVKLVDFQKPEQTEGIDLNKCMFRSNNVYSIKPTKNAQPPVQQHTSLPYHVVISGMFFVCSMTAIATTLLGIN